ncbi:MAG: hypothetical protein AAFY08_05975 [Planctomycetota bacterium]
MTALSTAVGYAGQVAAEKIVYRETFPVADGEGLKLTDANWQAWVYSPGDARVHRGAATYTVLMRDKPSQPANAMPINAGVDVESPLATGMLVNWNGGTFWPNPTLYMTEEFAIDDASTLTRVAWFQNNQSEAGGFRVALKIGPTWIVSDENFIGYGNRSLDISDAKWRHLNPADLSIDAEATITEPPEGPLNAFGVYGNHSGYAELDTFTLHAQPAPGG